MTHTTSVEACMKLVDELNEGLFEVADGDFGGCYDGQVLFQFYYSTYSYGITLFNHTWLWDSESGPYFDEDDQDGNLKDYILGQLDNTATIMKQLQKLRGKLNEQG